MTDTLRFEQLLHVAYEREKSAARRSSRRDGLTQLTALQNILQQVAAPERLPHLVAERLREKADHAQRRADRGQAAAERHVRKQARRISDPAAWHGWFDGSALPNPGRLGIGAVLNAPDGSVRHISRAAGMGDGNAAEYLALIALLELAVGLQVARLIVHGDSQVVIQDISGEMPVRTSALARSRTRAMQLMRQLASVELVWIPRARNQDADALARHGLAARHDDADQTWNRTVGRN